MQEYEAAVADQTRHFIDFRQVCSLFKYTQHTALAGTLAGALSSALPSALATLRELAESEGFST